MRFWNSESIEPALRFADGWRCTEISYPWTRVPTGRPPMDPIQSRLLPFADLFMGMMWSRPRGLSLEEAWVTPATMVLGLLMGTLGLVGGLAVLFYGASRSWTWIVAALVMFGLALGAGVLGLYGIRQRVLDR